jgi:agmatine deiminase
MFWFAYSVPGFQFITRKVESGIEKQTIAGIDWQFNAWGGMFLLN